MSRYIDADALLEDAKKDSMIAFFGSARMCDIQKLIDSQPTVDAVPVVRCKDCLYSRPLRRDTIRENSFVEGCVWCMEHDDGKFEDGFCSDGERKEE